MDDRETHQASVAEPLFLVGSVRSGSTLLRLMLDHHPEIAFEREFDPVSLVTDLGELPSVSAFIDSGAGSGYAVERSLDFREAMNDLLLQKQAASGDKPYIGATVHDHFDRLPFIWPRARYVHLVRDPRDVARSIVQKGWAGNLYQAIEYWLDAEDCWDSLENGLPSGTSIEVRYESLVSQTETELSRICRFIGVEYSPSMLDYRVDAPQYPPPDGNLASQWKTKLSQREVALVESRAAQRMEARGYAPSGFPKASIGPLRHRYLLGKARLRRLQARIGCYGVRLVAMDVLSRRLGLKALGRRAEPRLSAIDARMIEQESAGTRAPSANIEPAGLLGHRPDVTDGEHES